MTAIIVDDEKHCREVLEHLLSRHCHEVRLLANCASGAEVLGILQEESPDILFVDIEMPGMNGFELLEKCGERDFEIIFTTAYNEYAIKAIKHSALDYLLKPIDKEELKIAVARARAQKTQKPSDRINDLLQLLEMKKPAKRFAAATLEGLIMVNADDILYCESDSAYCKLYFSDGKSLLLSRTLKDVEESLSGENFCRIHHSYLINLNYVQKYIKGEGGEVIMNNGVNLPVSRTKKQDFLKLLEKI
ncbi:MAG TPA: LytTR family DNA-binding domain-containing protein [Saprospiraceae bacterium]|nr:LytTR family DNA-binding domain-containing protein [Saprospiraceae bacterium]